MTDVCDIEMINNFNMLFDNYIKTINQIFDFAIKNQLLPYRISIWSNYIKKYVIEHQDKMLDDGLKYILEYKDEIKNFNLDNLTELEDDNISLKYNKLKTEKKIDETQHNFTNIKPNEIIEQIIQIKNNLLKLPKNDIIIGEYYLKKLILILENIDLLSEIIN